MFFGLFSDPKIFPGQEKSSYGKLAGKNWPEVLKNPLKFSQKKWSFFSKSFFRSNCSTGQLKSTFDDSARKSLHDRPVSLAQNLEKNVESSPVD